MTSEIFAAVVISGTAGAILGVLIKHIQDTRVIKEINDLCSDHVRDVRAECERYEAELKKIITRQDAIITAQQTQTLTAQPRKIKFQDATKFFDLLAKEPLPTDWQEIDFPGSSEEV